MTDAWKASFAIWHYRSDSSVFIGLKNFVSNIVLISKFVFKTFLL